MPTRPARVCPKCKRTVPAGRKCPCSTRDNGSASSKITSTRRYRKMRAFYLAEHPACEQPGCPYPAVEVDHVKPVHSHPELAYDAENLRALCRDHHQAKTNTDRRRGRDDDDDDDDDEFRVSMP